MEAGGQDVAVLDHQVRALEAVPDPEHGIVFGPGVSDQAHCRGRDHSVDNKRRFKDI